jgi:hypothetical protein
MIKYNINTAEQNPITIIYGFTFDTSGLINEDSEALVEYKGDSMLATTSIRPWQSEFIPQHPDIPVGVGFEYTEDGGITEIIDDVSGSLASPTYLFPANSQSLIPQFIVDFYTAIGIKTIALKDNVGGAEFFKHVDTINWQAAPDGVLYDLSLDAFNAAKIIASVDNPLLSYMMCGLNDSGTTDPLLDIRNAIFDFVERSLVDYGSNFQMRFINLFSVNPGARQVAVEKFIIDAIKLKDFRNVQICASQDSSYDNEFMYGLVGDGHDQTHFHQRGLNLLGSNIVEYECIPRFDINIRNGRFPHFTNVASTSVTFNFKLLVNYKTNWIATVYWAIYPYDDVNHTTGEIIAGTGAIVFGSIDTVCETDEIISITGLSNNTRYRIQMYAEIGSYSTDVFRTINFYTRTSGNAPETDVVLARFSALDSNWITRITNFVEKRLDWDQWENVDDIWFNGFNNGSDGKISMKGIINPINLGIEPEFVSNFGYRTTGHTGNNRFNLQVNDFDFPNYLSNDGYYAINVWEDTNVTAAAFRAFFGNSQGTNRQSRLGVSYNTAISRFITYSINAGSSTIDHPLGSGNIELNKLHIVKKRATRSSSLDAELVIDGTTRFVEPSPAVSVANTVDWYMFAQNNNGTISARSSCGINLIEVGKASATDSDYITLSYKELGIGI